MILLGIAFAVYFLPSIVALGRVHHNAGAITLLNALVGWTVVGWIIALVWAGSAVLKSHFKSTAMAVWVLLSCALAGVGLFVLRTPIGSFVRERASLLRDEKARAPQGIEGNQVTVFRGSGEEIATPSFVVNDDWELRWEFRVAPVILDVERVNEYVTLDQMASIASKSERTIEKWARDKRDPLPAPDVPGNAESADQWKWDRIRPWLQAKTRKPFPQNNPVKQLSDLQAVEHPGTAGRVNFGRGGKYVVSFPDNEGPWKIEIVQLPNRIE